jgi:hypothetical protein
MEIMSEWEEAMGLDLNHFHILLSQGFYYLYPWGMSAFVLLIAYEFNIEYKNLPANIRSIPSYLKYGTNNENACLARAMGIKSRDVAIMLFEKSNRLSKKEFVRWLSNLTHGEINSFDINKYDIENINEVSIKINHSNFSNFLSEYSFEIKGTIFNQDWARQSMLVKTSDTLTYIRDENNIHDPFAIIILHENNPVGFVPRDYAKILSTEIDIEGKTYEIKVVKIVPLKTYSEITIKMSEAYEFVSFE